MAAMKRSSSAPPLDWPLSSDEKKHCVLSLFDQDVRAADHVIKSKERKLQELQSELEKEKARSADASGYPECDRTSAQNESLAPAKADLGIDSEQLAGLSLNSDYAADQLRVLIANASAALKVLESARNTLAEEKVENGSPRPVLRARSEGTRSAGQVVGILRKRRSRGPEKKRVSFGNKEPEPEMFTPEPEAEQHQEVLSCPSPPFHTPMDNAKQDLVQEFDKVVSRPYVEHANHQEILSGPEDSPQVEQHNEYSPCPSRSFYTPRDNTKPDEDHELDKAMPREYIERHREVSNKPSRAADSPGPQQHKEFSPSPSSWWSRLAESFSHVDLDYVP